MMMRAFYWAALASVSAASAAIAAPTKYDIDPNHTFPAFEADHQGGLSLWRGKLATKGGTIMIDRAAKTGEVDVTVDMASIDFSHEKMNERARSEVFFDVAKFPTATYKGKFSQWNGDVPAEVDGELTLHGVTKPVKLTINSFLCKIIATTKKEACGADAAASINRDEFGVDYAKQFGYAMSVKLLISVEAIKAEVKAEQ
jgi:polyisoprenoid-binding protein YceI